MGLSIGTLPKGKVLFYIKIKKSFRGTKFPGAGSGFFVKLHNPESTPGFIFLCKVTKFKNGVEILQKIIIIISVGYPTQQKTIGVMKMYKYNRKPTLDKTIMNFVTTLKDNKTDTAKKENILYFFNRVEVDCGAYGKIVEIMNGGKRKKEVSKQGKNDIYFSLEINGKVKRIQAENKTNGGRIGSLLDGSNGCKFVVYSMDVCNTGTNGVLRHLDPIIMPVDMFIDLLEEVGAIKAINKNGTFSDWGIQATSKELFLRLCDYPIVFNPSTVYTLDDFDGIEI